jgi:TolB protein
MPRWSPDGTRLLFTSDSSIQVVPSLGGAPRVVVGGASQPAWSPDGKEIAYVRADSLFARVFEGGNPRLLATGLELHSPAWSPDGRFIAYVSNILMVVPAASGPPVMLSGRKFLNMSPAWMPDSRHLLFMSTREGGRDLYSLQLDGSGHPRGPAVRLTTGLDLGTFSLSADGKALAYSSFPNTSNFWYRDRSTS